MSKERKQRQGGKRKERASKKKLTHGKKKGKKKEDKNYPNKDEAMLKTPKSAEEVKEKTGREKHVENVRPTISKVGNKGTVTSGRVESSDANSDKG